MARPAPADLRRRENTLSPSGRLIVCAPKIFCASVPRAMPSAIAVGGASQIRRRTSSRLVRAIPAREPAVAKSRGTPPCEAEPLMKAARWRHPSIYFCTSPPNYRNSGVVDRINFALFASHPLPPDPRDHRAGEIHVEDQRQRRPICRTSYAKREYPPRPNLCVCCGLVTVLGH